MTFLENHKGHRFNHKQHKQFKTGWLLTDKEEKALKIVLDLDIKHIMP